MKCAGVNFSICFVDVYVLAVETTSANLTIGGSATLRCEPLNLDPTEIEDLRFKWTGKNGAKLENPRATEHKENYTLEFQNLGKL